MIFIMSNVQHLKMPIKVHSIILFSLIHIILFAENVKQFNLLLGIQIELKIFQNGERRNDLFF